MKTGTNTKVIIVATTSKEDKEKRMGLSEPTSLEKDLMELGLRAP